MHALLVRSAVNKRSGGLSDALRRRPPISMCKSRYPAQLAAPRVIVFECIVVLDHNDTSVFPEKIYGPKFL